MSSLFYDEEEQRIESKALDLPKKSKIKLQILAIVIFVICFAIGWALNETIKIQQYMDLSLDSSYQTNK